MKKRTKQAVAAAYVVGVLMLTVVALTMGGTAAAANDAPYYDNESTEVGNETWMSGVTDGSLSSILDMATRVGPFIIGSGFSAQGGVGSAGVLLTGLLVGGVMAASGFRAGVGTVAGAVIAVVATFAMLTVGIGPTWAYPVTLFVVGVVAATVLLRAIR